MTKALFCILLTASSIFLFSSCANMGYPSGGKKDEAPPQVVKEMPSNKSVRFDAKSIIITFNEFIQLNDVANQVLVSPAFSEMPEIKLKKKSIIIPLKEPLRPHTTYTINFGNAIKDVSEGNTLEDYKYVFSTGEFVDSFKISGNVFFANSRKSEKGIPVMLYDNTEDSVVMKQKPVYYAKTADNGNFRIENIRGGAYKLFALKDQNFNLLYDLPNEQVAFPDSNIVVDETARNYELAMFQEDKGGQQLLNAYSKSFGKVIFIFTKAADSVRIIPQYTKQKPVSERWEYSQSRDSVTYWFSDIHLGREVFFIQEKGENIDTAEVKIPAIPQDSALQMKSPIAYPLFSPRDQKYQISQHLNQPFQITFAHPLLEHQPEKIIILEDSQAVSDFSISLDDSVKTEMKIQYNWKDTTPYSIIIPGRSFKDIFGLTNDSLVFSFKTKSAADYGNLEIKIKRNDGADYYLELLDEKEAAVKKIILSPENEIKINYRLLPPAKYQLKITRDENKNGKWDTGDYLKKHQPEKTFYYSQPIQLRANWDMEVELSVPE